MAIRQLLANCSVKQEKKSVERKKLMNDFVFFSLHMSNCRGYRPSGHILFYGPNSRESEVSSVHSA